MKNLLCLFLLTIFSISTVASAKCGGVTDDFLKNAFSGFGYVDKEKGYEVMPWHKLYLEMDLNSSNNVGSSDVLNSNGSGSIRLDNNTTTWGVGLRLNYPIDRCGYWKIKALLKYRESVELDNAALEMKETTNLNNGIGITFSIPISTWTK